MKRKLVSCAYENIPNLIDTKKSIKEQDKQAFDIRNTVKFQAI